MGKTGVNQPQVLDDFSAAAPEALIQEVAATLTANNFEAVVVDTGREAAERVIDLVPHGAEVHSGKSKTIEDIGLPAVFESGPYDWLRGRYLKMDRKTQAREMRKLSGTPDYMLGSAQAVLREGALVFASYSASQIGPIAGGAGHVLLVVGSQKIVPTWRWRSGGSRPTSFHTRTPACALNSGWERNWPSSWSLMGSHNPAA